MKILLAEDDANLAVITQLCLEKIGGHTVDVQPDGGRALQAATAKKYDLILLDGMMPVKSGLQVASELQSSDSNPPPIIFLSARSQDRDIEEFLKLGVGFISKPFDPQRICGLIEDILRKQKGHSA